MSKEVFKTNIELKEFMEKIGVECKPYLLKSRTVMVARAVRIVEKAEKQQLLNYIDFISEKLNKIPEEEKTQIKKKKSKKNYMKEVLELYGRKEG